MAPTVMSQYKSSPKLLDLFCGAGGASVGYSRAGFEVTGVDIASQPRYPYKFIQSDALSLEYSFLCQFDAIHASPPCQAYSDLAKRNKNAHMWPKLIEEVRSILISTGLPYVIENVEGAPLIEPIVLCGTMFPGLRVIRHRLFESNVDLKSPPHGAHPLVHTFDKRKRHFGKTDEWKDFVQVTGGGNSTLAAARDAMGINWMTKLELNESIPPAYTECIGLQLLSHVSATRSKLSEGGTALSAKNKLKAFFLAHIGVIVTSEQLREVAEISEWARRVRELRDEEGWEILSHNDLASLKPGEYLLEREPTNRRGIEFARGISAKLRAEVLDRNGFTCQMCGITPGETDPYTKRKVRLHIGHIVDKSLGGRDELSNLRTLCSSCNQGAKNITGEKPTAIWLLSQIRRSGIEEQRVAYEWLKKKFDAS